MAAVGSVECAPPSVGVRNLRAELIARCRKRPLAVLLDEAHTLDREVGRMLLNASQQVRDEAPFLLVLAGTPGLPAHLGTMNASFWSRLDEGRLGIGLLSAAAARAALVVPLAAHGVSIDAATLDVAVEDSQCYPYFIQVWGRALWQQRLATGAHRLNAAHAAAARPDVATRFTDYYEDRYLELDQSGWLAVAERVADRFQSMPTLTYEQLKVAVASGVAANADSGPADGPDRPAALGLRLAPTRTASAGALPARNSLADGLRTRPRRPDAWTIACRDQMALLQTIENISSHRPCRQSARRPPRGP